MAEEAVEQTVPQGADQTVQHATITEVPQPDAPTPESLGVDQASFDKYYKNDEFDWASYGKEQAFKAAQRQQQPAKEPAKPEGTEQGAQQAVEQAGLDWDSLGEKITAEGDISQDDYEALEKIGIPPHIVQDYIAAVKDQAQVIVDAVIDEFGGQDEFNAVHAALYTNATLDQRNKIDALLRDPDTRAAGVAQAYRLSGIMPGSAPAAPAQNQQAPAASRGNSASSQATPQGFSSFDEQMQAQRDPRYKTDIAYRNEVLQRIAQSDYQMNPRSHSGGL